MKGFRLLIILILLFISVSLVSCDDTERLKTPFGAEVEMTSLTLQWRSVAGARLYTIEITPEGGQRYEVTYSKNRYQLTSLDPGKYTLRVKANGKDGGKDDSEWSSPVEFEREAECGLVFSLNADKRSYTVKDRGTAAGDIVIPDTYRTYPVTAVGYKAFFDYRDITGITLGDNITRIEDFAFANCSYLTSMELPEGLTYIGESAFESCRVLDGDIVIPGGVEVVSKSAFAFCLNVDSFVISEGVKRIEKTAFSSCVQITSVALPDSLEYLGEYAFTVCTELSSIDLGEGLSTIDNYALSALPALSAVVIPDSVRSIGEGAFYECSQLCSVELGDTVTSIGKGAFEKTALYAPAEDGENGVYVGNWLVGLRSADVVSVVPAGQDPTAMELREGVIGIASYVFCGNKNLLKVVLPDTVQRIGRASFSESALTSIIIGEGVKYIDREAFLNCGYLSTVILGSYDTESGSIRRSSLISIGDSAFKNCYGLMRIDMPYSLKTVGSNSFLYSGLHYLANGVVYAGNWAVGYNGLITEDVVIDEGTVGVANYAFYKCPLLRIIEIPETVASIGTGAFYGCSELVSVDLPSTLTVIEDYTFYCCERLQLFSLPVYLRSIGRSAFYKCGTNSEVLYTDTDNDVLELPSTLVEIGAYAFYGCGYREDASIDEQTKYNYYGIDAIVLGDSVQSIGKYAFAYFCTLKSVDLGGAVSLGDHAFYKCESLVEADLGHGLTDLGDRAFYKCEALTSAVMPDTVKTVGDYAFYKCISLAYCDLGSAEQIGNYAFCGCVSLCEVYLPEGLKSIGKQAFRNCYELTSAVLGAEVEQIGAHAFYGDHKLTLYYAGELIPEGWHDNWNSSFRPVVTACELDGKGSVASFVAGDILNLNQFHQLSDPKGRGCVFLGWAASEDGEPAYSTAELSSAENGVRLYAAWSDQ